MKILSFILLRWFVIKILDNKINKIGDEIKDNIEKGSKISIISSYFSIYAFKELKKELSKVDKFRFIFTEPVFKDLNNNKKRSYLIEEVNSESLFAGNKYELKLRNELTQANIAKECAEWVKSKAEFKAPKNTEIVGSKFIHIKNNKKEDLLINNTNDFSASGLGYTESNQMIFANSTTESFLWRTAFTSEPSSLKISFLYWAEEQFLSM